MFESVFQIRFLRYMVMNKKKLTEKEVLILNEPVFDLQKYTRNYFITIMWILFLFNSNNSIFIYPHRLSKYTPTLFRCY